MVFQITQNNKRDELLRYLQSDTTGLAGLSQFKVTLSGDGRAFGTFKNDPFRLRSGVALSTGRVADLPGINTADGRNTYTGGTVKDSSKDLNTDFAPNGVQGDDIKLQIDFYADGSKDNLYFQYGFGSEEFKEYAGQSFNDKFSLSLNGIDYAYLPNGKLVTINNLLNSPLDGGKPYYINNPVNTGPASNETRLDGFTIPLFFTAPLKKNALNSLIIRVQDVGDGLYDSAVFIKAGTFGTRRPPDIPLTDTDGSLNSGSGGNNIFDIDTSDSVVTLTDFGGVGRGVCPTPEVTSEVDTLRFTGTGLTAKNMLLNKSGADLEIQFEGFANPQVILKNFSLENLDNLQKDTGACIDLGNILFDGQTEIQDSFDVFNADSVQRAIWNHNTVTFLNDLDNNVQGFDNSDDVINGQGGNDTIVGLSGNDLLRGEAGDDLLRGEVGADVLIGDVGNDTLYLGVDCQVDTVVYRSGDGTDIVNQFTHGSGGDLLRFKDIPAIDVVVNGSSTWFQLSDGIGGNAGFGSGDPLLKLNGTIGFTSANIGLNIAAGNTTQFLFA